MEGSKDFSWREVLTVYSRREVIAMAFLGFGGGLPYLLVFSTLTAWLRDVGLSRSAIGFFAWIGLMYSIKVLWAPVVDRMRLRGLTDRFGQRRGWMLLGQGGVMLGLVGMSMVAPADNLVAVAILALIVAFSSATQDIAIDAFRIEAMADEYQGAMSASYIFGYRVALLAAGAGALFLADLVNWNVSYLIMAALMLVAVVAVLFVAEPPRHDSVGVNQSLEVESASMDRVLPHMRGRARELATWFVGAMVFPFVDFFQRNGRFAIVVLLFIAVFRLSDIAMGVMANPFYLDLGFTKTEIAGVAKAFGFFMSIAGSFICGLAVVRWGILSPLLAGAVAVAATNLLFALLAVVDADLRWLALVISADNLSGGFAATAFVAYLSSLTNRAYTATQYALFSSLMTLPGKFVSGFSGLVVDSEGYATFFVVAAAMGVPAIVLVVVLMHRARVTASTDRSPA